MIAKSALNMTRSTSVKEKLTLFIKFCLISSTIILCHECEQQCRGEDNNKNDKGSRLLTSSTNQEATATSSYRWLRSLDDPNFDDNEDRYIVKFKDKPSSKAGTNDAIQNGNHVLSLPKENSEVMTLQTMTDIQLLEERDDIEYVERDYKVYLYQVEEIENTNEILPYGIDMVHAFNISDEFISNQKVCNRFSL